MNVDFQNMFQDQNQSITWQPTHTIKCVITTNIDKELLVDLIFKCLTMNLHHICLNFATGSRDELAIKKMSHDYNKRLFVSWQTFSWTRYRNGVVFLASSWNLEPVPSYRNEHVYFNLFQLDLRMYVSCMSKFNRKYHLTIFDVSTSSCRSLRNMNNNWSNYI